MREDTQNTMKIQRRTGFWIFVFDNLNSSHRRTGGMYVQIYVYPMARKNTAAFLRIQREAGDLYKNYGAVDDETFGPANLEPKYGCEGFPNVLDLKQDETVFFSITRFRDRAHQDQVMARVNVDKRINELYNQVSALIELNRVVRGEFEGT